jgi:hypothetical protein
MVRNVTYLNDHDSIEMLQHFKTLFSNAVRK